MEYYTLKQHTVNSTPIIILASLTFILLVVFLLSIHQSACGNNILQFHEFGLFALVGAAFSTLATIIVIATSKG